MLVNNVSSQAAEEKYKKKKESENATVTTEIRRGKQRIKNEERNCELKLIGTSLNCNSLIAD